MIQASPPVYKNHKKSNTDAVAIRTIHESTKPKVTKNIGYNFLHFSTWIGRLQAFLLLLRFDLSPEYLDWPGKKILISATVDK